MLFVKARAAGRTEQVDRGPEGRMSITTRPPLGVLRQLSRAVLADRLIGDELMRLTMARVDVDPQSSSASVTDLAAAFVQSWRQASREDGKVPMRFSDASLARALPEPPGDGRLVVLLVDVLGFAPVEAARIVGTHTSPGALLAAARDELTIRGTARAVVVEDEPLIAADLRVILERSGVEVVGEARTAEDAVRAAAETDPDIILADYNLAGRATGLDAVIRIKQSNDCPVVFITGYPDRVLQGDEVEPDFVISKPYTADNVRAAVVHCLDARRA